MSGILTRLIQKAGCAWASPPCGSFPPYGLLAETYLVPRLMAIIHTIAKIHISSFPVTSRHDIIYSGDTPSRICLTPPPAPEAAFRLELVEGG